MDLLRKLNAKIATDAEAAQVQADIDAATELLDNAPLPDFDLRRYYPDVEQEVTVTEDTDRLDELFAGAKKKAEQERIEKAKEYARNAGKSGRVEKNKKASTSGGVDNSGKLAELNKEYGIAVFGSDGKLPKKPNGMTQADYDIWIAKLLAEMESRRSGGNGPSIGPKKGAVVRKDGKIWIISNPSVKNLVALIKNKEGQEAEISWSSLPKAKNIDGQQVYDLK